MKIKPIAIHLPQFHPIPENDKWWGKGFTEWTNVAKSKPLFKGHYQPHIPADLGFYDLRLEEARMEQAQLAQQYGIYGFCYYHYWFNGKRLLEQPVNKILQTGKPDFPFMICWANENWSRRWDGSEHEILIAQNYSKSDAIDHSKTLIKHFVDERYIRVLNKPFFSIYKPYLIPNLDEYISIIRDEVYKMEKLELFICGFGTGSPLSFQEIKSFDSIIEFQPQSKYLWDFMEVQFSKKVYHNKKRKLYNHLLQKVGGKKMIESHLHRARFHLDYNEYVDYILKNYSYPAEYDLFPCVNPMWDNTARRGSKSFLFYNETPEKYGQWVSYHLHNYKYKAHGENFLFINAWNEWAEGNHLEPCQKWGRQYLEQTKQQLGEFDNENKDN